MSDCCTPVGNFPGAPSGVFSVNVSSKTETMKIGDNLVVGPTIGSVSVSGYATRGIHKGCVGSASISVPWIRRYDCDEDKVYFIFGGAGQASIAGEVAGLASLVEPAGRAYKVISANSSSGPSALYGDYEQSDGYGLSYNGDPFPFTTDDSGGATFGSILGLGTLYLQSFNLSLTPGQVPVASYSFVFTVDG